MKRVIELTPAEIQSKLDRVKWAEGLIRQLPESHEGRNSWLLNYAAQVAVIDWGKAPEDATHGRVTTAGVDFYKRMLGEWVYLNSRNQGERAYRTSESNCEERPKSTPAALRNKACDEMFGVILKLPEDRRHNRSDIVEALYDAGYRKFEIVDGEA